MGVMPVFVAYHTFDWSVATHVSHNDQKHLPLLLAMPHKKCPACSSLMNLAMKLLLLSAGIQAADDAAEEAVNAAAADAKTVTAPAVQAKEDDESDDEADREVRF